MRGDSSTALRVTKKQIATLHIIADTHIHHCKQTVTNKTLQTKRYKQIITITPLQKIITNKTLLTYAIKTDIKSLNKKCTGIGAFFIS